MTMLSFPDTLDRKNPANHRAEAVCKGRIRAANPAVASGGEDHSVIRCNLYTPVGDIHPDELGTLQCSSGNLLGKRTAR